MPFLDLNRWYSFSLLWDLDAEANVNTGTREHVRLSYHRPVLMPFYEGMARDIPPILGWGLSEKILIAGAGFGWFVEALKDHGYTDVFAAETSRFIQVNKNSTEEADINAAIGYVGITPIAGDGALVKDRLFDGGPRARVTILNEDGSTSGSRARIQQAMGGSVSKVFTENVLEALTDAEAVAYTTELRKLPPCTHLVAVLTDGSTPGLLNWHSLAQWKALIPQDQFMDDSTYQVL